MTAIDQKTEQRIKEAIRKTTCIRVDESEIYLASYQRHTYLRYVEDQRHITFSTRAEKAKDLSFAKRLSSVFAGRYPRVYVVQVEIPLTWDAESEPISNSHREIIADRVKRAVLKKYASCMIEPVDDTKSDSRSRFA